ncbi:hypothetical protein HanIR_Chr02g0099511 [Helianthus annuus]|nr:hypothetical protein HanIR_Chr02g0099511 [Helianthus annuus]
MWSIIEELPSSAQPPSKIRAIRVPIYIPEPSPSRTHILHPQTPLTTPFRTSRTLAGTPKPPEPPDVRNRSQLIVFFGILFSHQVHSFCYYFIQLCVRLNYPIL